MSKVKLELSQGEYQKLIEMAYLGNWLVNAHRNEEIKEYSDLEKKIFSNYKEAGMEDEVNHYPDLDDMYEFENSYEEKLHTYIKDYEDYNFWEELTYRLANRDLLRELGPVGKLQNKDIERRLELAEKYEDEFVKNGLKNVKVGK
ncbi:hypothetical protein [Sediminibacillus albus]|uniref:Uncharacterized protein n=1 Tax=Sediminibacillus albus TaxID=407036 RepID=A0A1G8XGV1_9BACI|nr:hypothetical protein [Sediminibacillus albus]SDJ89798.1 hypothetical protein SAMN05216243_1357 [Sediminibacillus albus]